jgi:ADP-ribose pyrophosphatase YjhB (NUDIX family)
LNEISPAVLAEAERRFGAPREAALEERLLGWEMDLIERVCGDSRFHDVTVFVMSEGRLALVHKPSEPAGVFWAPAGGVLPGEELAEGVRREVLEETGLSVVAERYLLRVRATFLSQERSRPWTSHVFLARPVEPLLAGRPLTPIDTKEVESAAWLGVQPFLSETVPLLRQTGWGRFRYRLGLARLAFEELGLPPVVDKALDSIQAGPPLE